MQYADLSPKWKYSLILSLVVPTLLIIGTLVFVNHNFSISFIFGIWFLGVTSMLVLDGFIRFVRIALYKIERRYPNFYAFLGILILVGALIAAIADL